MKDISRTLNRRQWMRTTALAAGSLGLVPVSGLCETPRMLPQLSPQGDLRLSPFFSEYISSGALVAAPSAKLNANENPYGPSAKAMEALREAAPGGNRYAWRELISLMEKIAEKEGLDTDHLIMGPGSSDLLEKTAMVLFQHGGNIVSADPSYMSMIQVAQACGAQWKPIPLKPDWSHDLDAMEAAVDSDTKLVYVCNPNNPTGTLTDAKALLDFCSRVSENVPVFVDEAYLDFLEPDAQQSMVSLIREGKNVIVARTFSKIHGLAGLRVGYALGLPRTLEALQAITRAGMGISGTSIAAAAASMADLPFLEQSRIGNREVRRQVFEGLKSMGLDPVPSYTSFMIFPIEMEGKAFLEKMAGFEVGVRAFRFFDRNWCRVSMGTEAEMALFMEALGKTLI